MTRSYHHGNLREALVEAAVDVVRERGPDAVALRELARTLGVSHNAAYRHFGDRQELMSEIAIRGMGELSSYIGRSQAEVDAAHPDDAVLRARARMHAIGRAYVQFATAEPGLFRVAFSDFASLPEPADDSAAADPFQQLVACLDDLVAVGWMSPSVRPDAEIACWSMVHGFAMLSLEGPLRDAPVADLAAALARALQIFDRSWAASTGRLDELADLPEQPSLGSGPAHPA